MRNYQELHNQLTLATSANDRRKVAFGAWERAESDILHHLQSPGVEPEAARALLDELLHAVATVVRTAEFPLRFYPDGEEIGRLADKIEPDSYRSWTPDESLAPRVFTAVLTFGSSGDSGWAKKYTKGAEGVRATKRAEVLLFTGTEGDVRKAVETVEQMKTSGGESPQIVDFWIEEGILVNPPGLADREGTKAFKAMLRFMSGQAARHAHQAAKIARPDFATRVQYISLALSGPDMDSVTQVALDLKQRFGAAVELWQGKELATRRKWGL